MPLAPGNWEMKMPNNVTPSSPGPPDPQAVPGTSSAPALRLSPLECRVNESEHGTALISAQQFRPGGSLSLTIRSNAGTLQSPA